ncbi:hypothetical protein J3F84DRAFT_377830 [Trichoderma pleuroticola]
MYAVDVSLPWHSTGENRAIFRTEQFHRVWSYFITHILATVLNVFVTIFYAHYDAIHGQLISAYRRQGKTGRYRVPIPPLSSVGSRPRHSMIQTANYSSISCISNCIYSLLSFRYDIHAARA